ncbi:MAG: MFS transporter [Anaerolineaceae bacterium]|jgi:DHA3 family macrolide efflux protein-like MFS transporter
MSDTNWKRQFFSFWGAQAVSLLGSGLASFALIWWMTVSTQSASVLALASLAGMLPGVLIGPLAGALVDRWDRKWVMIVSDGVSAILAALLVALFWLQAIQVWHVYLILAIRGMAGTFQFPAIQSSTALMVPKEHLARVAGLNQALQGVTMIAAPALGALLLALLPLHSILAIDVISAAIAIGLLFVSRVPQPLGQPAAAGVKGVWQDMRAGFAYIVRWPALRSVLVVSALLNLVLPPAFSLVPILVTKHFAGGAPQLAWMNAAYGLGFLAGGILLGVWGGFKRRVFTSLLGLAGLGLGSFLIGIAPTFAIGLGFAAMAVLGMMNPLANGPFFAILLAVVDSKMQGRVFTVLMSVSLAMAPVGLAIAGPLADRFGVQVWYLLSALLCVFMLIWIVFNPALLHMEEPTERRSSSGDGEQTYSPSAQ